MEVWARRLGSPRGSIYFFSEREKEDQDSVEEEKTVSYHNTGAKAFLSENLGTAM